MKSLIKAKNLIFLLLPIVASQSYSQLIPLPLTLLAKGTMATNHSRANIKLLKSIKFDSSTSLLYVPYSSNQNDEYKNLSFMINNVEELNKLKQGLILTEYKNEEIEKSPMVLYVLRNKSIFKYWYVFPKLQSIATQDGYFSLDSSWLRKKAIKHHLSFTVEIDTFTTQSEYLKYKEKVKLNDSSFLIIDPYIDYAGSFEVTTNDRNLIADQDATVEKLYKLCNHFSKANSFNIFTKSQNEGNINKESLSYVIKCDKNLFEKFSDKAFKKLEWLPTPIILKIYWKQ